MMFYQPVSRFNSGSVRGLLDGKVALVTGGSRGLGRAMLLAFARSGANVIVASRQSAACDAVRHEAESFGVEALAVSTNVSSWSECDRLVDRSYERFGAVDILVNNAGMSPQYDSLPDVSEALFDKVIGVNLRGPFRLMASVGSRMAAAQGGSIINVTSVEVEHPDPGALPYAAAKGGLEVLTSGFMRAFGPTVRVNAIRCGLFRTDISKAWGSDAQIDAMAMERIVLQRVGEPNDVVGAALFLASDASAYCTGTTIRLDGGTP